MTSILDVTLEHPKNWLIVLSVYEITLEPEYNVPDLLKPIVESTSMTFEFIITSFVTLVLGVIIKSPWIASDPIKRFTL